MKLISGVDHIAIAVRNLEKALAFYRDLFGLEVYHRETIQREGINIAYIRIGDLSVEFMEPFDASSFVGRQIEKNGQGLAHLCFRTDDLSKLIGQLRSRGLVLLSEGPMSGAEGRSMIFLHPKDNSGVLTEFCETRSTRQKSEK